MCFLISSCSRLMCPTAAIYFQSRLQSLTVRLACFAAETLCHLVDDKASDSLPGSSCKGPASASETGRCQPWGGRPPRPPRLGPRTGSAELSQTVGRASARGCVLVDVSCLEMFGPLWARPCALRPPCYCGCWVGGSPRGIWFPPTVPCLECPMDTQEVPRKVLLEVLSWCPQPSGLGREGQKAQALECNQQWRGRRGSG